jgi:hypothetical protein
MKVTKATKKVQDLLDEFANAGYLLDVYSKSFFDRQPSYKENPYADFPKESYQNILDEHENNLESDLKPIGHLLFIRIDEHESNLRKKLVEVYEPLKAVIDFGKHNPDFLIINLFTQQILCIGLGRKNRLFAIDAETKDSINAFGLLDGVHASGLMASKDAGYVYKLIEHDVSECITELLHALHTLGAAMYGYDGMQANLEEIEHTLDSGPNEEGYYELKNWDDEKIDGEQYSKDEIISMLNEAQQYRKDEIESMRMINIFFPDCDRSELNTVDY